MWQKHNTASLYISEVNKYLRSQPLKSYLHMRTSNTTSIAENTGPKKRTELHAHDLCGQNHERFRVVYIRKCFDSRLEPFAPFLPIVVRSPVSSKNSIINLASSKTNMIDIIGSLLHTAEYRQTKHATTHQVVDVKINIVTSSSTVCNIRSSNFGLAVKLATE